MPNSRIFQSSREGLLGGAYNIPRTSPLTIVSGGRYAQQGEPICGSPACVASISRQTRIAHLGVGDDEFSSAL